MQELGASDTPADAAVEVVDNMALIMSGQAVRRDSTGSWSDTTYRWRRLSEWRYANPLEPRVLGAKSHRSCSQPRVFDAGHKMVCRAPGDHQHVHILCQSSCYLSSTVHIECRKIFFTPQALSNTLFSRCKLLSMTLVVHNGVRSKFSAVSTLVL